MVGGMEGNNQSSGGLNNDSLLAIESDLVAIEERELETMYSGENATRSLRQLEPSMKGLMEHLAFHLWFFIPCVILFIPAQPKFIDRIVQVCTKFFSQ